MSHQDVIYFQHALDCGINMTGKLALPVRGSIGYLLMVDVEHPVTRDPIIHAGTTMDADLIDLCIDAGLDYVIVYKHPPVLRDLERYATSDVLAELIDRMSLTNGLDFCSGTSILQARDMLTAHLAAA